MEVASSNNNNAEQDMSDKPPYVCRVEGCGREYTQKRYLQKHCSEIHKEEQQIDGFRCELNGCTKVLACERYLKNHQQKVHFSPPPVTPKSPKIMYVCMHKDCGRSFSKPSRLRDHEFIHTGERPHKCPQPGCNHSYTRAAHLKRHQKSHDDEEMKNHIWCPKEDCKQEFANRTNLLKHMTFRHDKQYKCPEQGCDERFHKKRQLRQHAAVYHLAEPGDAVNTRSQDRFLCIEEGCGKDFSELKLLRHHQKSHKQDYKCELCGEHFTKWTLFRKHKSVKHGRVHECETCKKMFHRRRHLLEHQQTHDPVNEKKFVCSHEGCHHAYTLERNLKAHVRSVHQGKKFECTHEGCDRKFAFKASVQKHMKEHDANRPLPKPKKKKKKIIRKKTLENVKNYLSRTSSPVFPLPSKAPSAEALDLRLVKVTQSGEVVQEPMCTVTSAAHFGMSDDDSNSNPVLDLSIKKGPDVCVKRMELTDPDSTVGDDDDERVLRLFVNDNTGPTMLQIEVMSDEESEMKENTSKERYEESRVKDLSKKKKKKNEESEMEDVSQKTPDNRSDGKTGVEISSANISEDTHNTDCEENDGMELSSCDVISDSLDTDNLEQHTTKNDGCKDNDGETKAEVSSEKQTQNAASVMDCQESDRLRGVVSIMSDICDDLDTDNVEADASMNDTHKICESDDLDTGHIKQDRSENDTCKESDGDSGAELSSQMLVNAEIHDPPKVEDDKKHNAESGTELSLSNVMCDDTDRIKLDTSEINTCKKSDGNSGAELSSRMLVHTEIHDTPKVEDDKKHNAEGGTELALNDVMCDKLDTDDHKSDKLKNAVCKDDDFEGEENVSLENVCTQISDTSSSMKCEENTGES